MTDRLTDIEQRVARASFTFDTEQNVTVDLVLMRRESVEWLIAKVKRLRQELRNQEQLLRDALAVAEERRARPTAEAPASGQGASRAVTPQQKIERAKQGKQARADCPALGQGVIPQADCCSSERPHIKTVPTDGRMHWESDRERSPHVRMMTLFSNQPPNKAMEFDGGAFGA